jgi:hypothetical protein
MILHNTVVIREDSTVLCCSFLTLSLSLSLFFFLINEFPHGTLSINMVADALAKKLGPCTVNLFFPLVPYCLMIVWAIVAICKHKFIFFIISSNPG